MSLTDLSLHSSLHGTTIVNVCISPLDVFLCDDEWHEPVTSEVGGIGAHACQFEFFTLAVVTDAAGAPFTANKMKFAAPTAQNSKLHWHAVIMLRRKGAGFWYLAINPVAVEKVTEFGACEGDNNKVISRRELVMLHAIAILGGWLLMMVTCPPEISPAEM